MKSVFEAIVKGLLVNATTAKVMAVDKQNQTCDVKPLNGATEMPGVYLRTDNGTDKGLVIYPAIDSLVIVASLDNSNSHFYVQLFSDVEAVSTEVETTKTLIDKDGILIKRGSENLAKLLTDLVTEVINVYAPKNVPKLIEIKTRITNLLKDA